MKFIKYQTLNEAIAEVSEKDQGVIGPVYADAVRQSKKIRKDVANMMAKRKLVMPNEDRFAHTKFKGTKSQKEMHLTEGVEADGANPIIFAEEPAILKNIIVKDDNKGNLTYVKEDGTQIDLKGLDFEEVDLGKEDLLTNQKVINKEKLDNFIKSVDELPPVVVAMNDEGKYHIIDGNHRSIAFITAGKEVPAYSYLLSEIEDRLAKEGIKADGVQVTSEIKDGLTEQKWLTIKDMEVETPDGNKIKVAVTAPASVIMAVEKDDVNNGIDSGLYDRDGLILDDYFLMMESESGISSNKYQDYLKAMGKNVDEEIQQCQKFPIDFKKAKILNEKGLTESWDKEDFRSRVYNALADIAFEYHLNGVDLSAEDFTPTFDWFTTKFKDEAEWNFDDSLEEEVAECQKYPVEKPEAKDSQFYSAEDKQPELHINVKDSQFISAGDKDPRSASINEEVEDINESSYARTDGELFVGPRRDSLVSVIISTLCDGEWGYIKSKDGTISPTVLKHLSLDETKDIGVDWDKEDRCFIRVVPRNTVTTDEIQEVANQFHKESEVVDEHGDKVVRIYVDEDKDFDGHYVGDDYPVNTEGVKGRGTGKRGNPNSSKKVEAEEESEIKYGLEEEIQPDQKFPVNHKEAPAIEEEIQQD